MTTTYQKWGRAQYLRLKKKGTCACGEPARPNRVLCAACNEKQTVRSRERIAQRRAEGICTLCGREPAADSARCTQCSQKLAKKRRRLMTQKGDHTCCQCSKPRYNGLRYCLGCWCRTIANYGGRFRGVGDIAVGLAALLEKQDFKCAYTGVQLIPGVNASVDHITPLARDGRHELSNLQWVDRYINNMKRELTHQEFLDRCREIAARFP